MAQITYSYEVEPEYPRKYTPYSKLPKNPKAKDLVFAFFDTKRSHWTLPGLSTKSGVLSIEAREKGFGKTHSKVSIPRILMLHHKPVAAFYVQATGKRLIIANELYLTFGAFGGQQVHAMGQADIITYGRVPVLIENATDYLRVLCEVHEHWRLKIRHMCYCGVSESENLDYIVRKYEKLVNFFGRSVKWSDLECESLRQEAQERFGNRLPTSLCKKVSEAEHKAYKREVCVRATRAARKARETRRLNNIRQRQRWLPVAQEPTITPEMIKSIFLNRLRTPKNNLSATWFTRKSWRTFYKCVWRALVENPNISQETALQIVCEMPDLGMSIFNNPSFSLWLIEDPKKTFENWKLYIEAREKAQKEATDGPQR